MARELLGSALRVAVMFGSGAVGCQGSAVERDAFAIEAEQVRSLSTPTSGRVEGIDQVVREPLRVSQEWRIVPQMNWSTFVAAGASLLAGRYRCTAEAERLSCSRSIPGDEFSLSYAPAGLGQVRARLEAHPD